MKIFSRLFVLILCVHTCVLSMYSQKTNIKEVKMLLNDLTASKYQRKDSNGKNCAIIRVQLPTVKGIQFSKHVGDVKHNSGEYIVYVSPGIKSLTITNDVNTLCVVDFAKEGIEISSKRVYQVVLSQEQSLNKVFKIEPVNASLFVNGQIVSLSEDGVGSIECEVDKMYNYTISASGYETIEDAFMISPEDETVEPINVTLDRKMAMVKFQSNVDNVEVLLNDESWGVVDNGQQIELPIGTWNVRLVADKYDDWMSKVTVTEQSNIINASLKKSEDVSKKLRSRTSFYVGGGFAFPLESRTEMNKENVKGYPVRLGLDFETYMKRWLTFRIGIEAMALCGNDIQIDDKTPFSVNIPLVFSINAPLGKFNRNHFSVGVGPVIGYASLLDDEENSSNSSSDEDKGLLLGGRLEARFSFNHFILGVNVDYLNSEKVIGGDGIIAPMVSLGYKF